ncbi:MAG TPA: tetratricopeptide repeat protein [Firmicutes bacterium]|nr:tetratricopeptide repeat protein [Candidatus Fermentithermobacillaceae bacterium]
MKPVLSRTIALLRTGDVEKAEALLQARLSSERNDPALTNALGVLRAFSGRYDEARELFEASLLTSRNKAKVLCNLGNLCLVNNDPEGALRYYAQAMEASFMAPEPRYNAARAYQEMGQFEKALQAILDYDDCRAFQRRLGIITFLTGLLAIAYVAALILH